MTFRLWLSLFTGQFLLAALFWVGSTDLHAPPFVDGAGHPTEDELYPYTPKALRCTPR